jgi:hypothetical protein
MASDVLSANTPAARA